MFFEERSSTHYITMWNKGVQQHHCGVLSLLHGVPVSRRARLSEKARSEPTLPPSKLWRLRKPLPALFAWGPAQEGQKPSQETLLAGSPRAGTGAVAHANQQMLCLLLLAISSLHTTSLCWCLAKKYSLIAPPLRSQEAAQCQCFDGQHAASMGWKHAGSI